MLYFQAEAKASNRPKVADWPLVNMHAYSEYANAWSWRLAHIQVGKDGQWLVQQNARITVETSMHGETE